MLLLHHHELWRVRPSACSLNLKVELVPPPFPRACYISSPFRFILQCLLEYLLSRSTFRMPLLDCCKQLIQTVCPRSHSHRVQVSPSNMNHIKITITDYRCISMYPVTTLTVLKKWRRVTFLPSRKALNWLLYERVGVDMDPMRRIDVWCSIKNFAFHIYKNYLNTGKSYCTWALSWLINSSFVCKSHDIILS